jgi:hypothetical protein
MKKIILFLIIASSTLAFSQSSDKEPYTVTYIQAPLFPLEKEMSKYKIEVENNSNIDFQESQLIKNAELKGFKYDETSPDFIVKIKIDPIKEDSYVKKKMGTESFNFTVESELNIRKEIYSVKDEGTYYEGSLSQSPLFTVKNTSQTLSKSEAEAKKALKQNLQAYTNSNLETLKSNLLSKIGEELNAIHGYPTKTFESVVYTIKPKKFEYHQLDKASSDFIIAMAEYSDLGLTPKVEDLLLKCITIWEAEIQQLDLANRKARINEKNVSGLYLNLAQAYLWLQRFELAKKNLADSKEFKGGSMYASLIENLIVNLQVGFNQNELRETGKLDIKKNSPVIYSEQFVPENNGWRQISKTDYYGQEEKKVRETKKLTYYRDFIISEKYGLIDNKYVYDNDSLIAYVYNKFDALKAKLYVRNGKPTKITLYSRTSSGKEMSKTFEMNFDSSGNFLGYQQIDGHQKMEITYESGLVKEVSIKKKSEMINDTSHFTVNHKYQYLNNKEIQVNSIMSNGNSFTYAITKDNTGNISKVNLKGYESTTYHYDTYGNLIEALKGTDTGVERNTFQWEKAVGNASLFSWITLLQSVDPPFVFPYVY